MKNEENKIHRGKLIIRNRIGNSIKFPLASIEFMQIYVLRESCGILAGVGSRNILSCFIRT